MGSNVLMGLNLCRQPREGAGEPCRARRRRDLEQSRGLAGIELEQDAQRDDLAVGCTQPSEARLERGRVAVAQAGCIRRGAFGLALRGEPLARAAALLGTQVVERTGARDREQPAARARAARVEAIAPLPGPLERVGREILGQRAVAGEVDEIAMNVAEMRLDELIEGLGPCSRPCAYALHCRIYAAAAAAVTAAPRSAHGSRHQPAYVPRLASATRPTPRSGSSQASVPEAPK